VSALPATTASATPVMPATEISGSARGTVTLVTLVTYLSYVYALEA